MLGGPEGAGRGHEEREEILAGMSAGLSTPVLVCMHTVGTRRHAVGSGGLPSSPASHLHSFLEVCYP